jgi:hypothetical protein
MLNQQKSDPFVQAPRLESQLILGKSYLVRHAFENKNINEEWNSLRRRLTQNPYDAAALLDISIILLLQGKRAESMQAQAAALEISKIYYVQSGIKKGLRLLAFVAPGDLMSNTPFEFLLEGSDFNVILYYVDENTFHPSTVPEHDVAMIAISESAANASILKNISKMLETWPGPLINNKPEIISNLTRDGVTKQFNKASHVFSPSNMRCSRQDLASKKFNDIAKLLDLQNGNFLIRPVDSHAGEGLQKMTSQLEFENYKINCHADEFYISPFIEYQNSDGLFRKYRIAFINGKPFPAHLAISSHWMVHYLNADMALHPSRRSEEEKWFEDFETFAARNANALKEISNTIALDYFVIDCSIMPDGRILLFEADTGMIVHDMDPVELYPYKKTAMKKLFCEFQEYLKQAAQSQELSDKQNIAKVPTFLLN